MKDITATIRTITKVSRYSDSEMHCRTDIQRRIIMSVYLKKKSD